LTVGAHADHASNEIAVALRSCRTRTTVPSRMSRTIGSSASERTFQASQFLDLAPYPAHRVLADRAGEQRAERPSYTPRVGAGEVAAIPS
jgi:hypothetical protein